MSCDNGSTDVSNPTTAHVHKWGAWEETTAAQDSVKGEETRVCEDDKEHTETRDIPQLKSLITTVEVEAGKFIYGKNGAEAGGTLVEVQAFKMGKYLVTQEEWKAVMGADKNLSYFDGEKAFDMDDDYNEIKANPKFNRDNLPVETVSWYDVLVFANKLSMKEGLNPVYEINGKTDPAEWGEVPTGANDDDWDV